MSRLREIRYECKCCTDFGYPRRISKNEAQEEIQAEIWYTPAEQRKLLYDYYHKDDDDDVEEEMQAVAEYIPDSEKSEKNFKMGKI